MNEPQEQKRLCTCDRIRIGQSYTPDQCRVCWLFYHDEGYNRLWGGNGNTKLQQFAKTRPNETPRCIWLGDATGEVVTYTPACGCKIQLPIFKCDVHGRTTGRRIGVDGASSCFGCQSSKLG